MSKLLYIILLALLLAVPQALKFTSFTKDPGDQSLARTEATDPAASASRAPASIADAQKEQKATHLRGPGSTE